MAQSLKMKVVETGTFKELFVKAKTGSVIEFGRQEDNDGFIANSLGRYFTHENLFFAVTMDGERRSLGSHDWDRWRVCDKGLFIARGNSIIAVNENGSETPLNTFDIKFNAWNGWYVSNKGLYFPNVNGFTFINGDEKREIVIPQFAQFNDFGVNDYGIYLQNNRKFFLADMHGEIKPLGEYHCGRWAVGTLGLYLDCNGEIIILHIDGRTIELGDIGRRLYASESPYGVFTTQFHELFLHVVK